MAQTNKPAIPEEVLLPVMASAMLGQGQDNDALKQLIGGILQDYADKRKKEKERDEKLRLSTIRSIAEEKATKEQQQRICSPRKQNDETRLGGQYLSNGQLSLVCSFCHKNFFMPPKEGQTAPPRDLMPSGDSIGG